MKFKSLLTASVAAGAILASSSAHADNWYLSIFGGINSPDLDGVQIGPLSYSHVFPVYAYKTTAILKIADGIGPSGTYARMYGGSLGGSIVFAFSTNAFGYTSVGQFNFDEVENGFVVGAALGMDFDDGWRAELELAWRKNDLDHRQNVSAFYSYYATSNYFDRWYGTVYLFSTPTRITPTSTVATWTRGANTVTFGSTAGPLPAVAHFDGDVTTFSVMANLWYDFDLGGNSPIYPFVGVGVGGANVSVDLSGTLPLFNTTATFATDTDDWVFAWQAGAGLAYEFAGGAALSAQYRYFATGDVSVAGQDIGLSAHEGLIALSFPLGR